MKTDSFAHALVEYGLGQGFAKPSGRIYTVSFNCLPPCSWTMRSCASPFLYAAVGGCKVAA